VGEKWYGRCGGYIKDHNLKWTDLWSGGVGGVGGGGGGQGTQDKEDKLDKEGKDKKGELGNDKKGNKKGNWGTSPQRLQLLSHCADDSEHSKTHNMSIVPREFGEVLVIDALW
jgi:hypothetical protein